MRRLAGIEPRDSMTRAVLGARPLGRLRRSRAFPARAVRPGHHFRRICIGLFAAIQAMRITWSWRDQLVGNGPVPSGTESPGGSSR